MSLYDLSYAEQNETRAEWAAVACNAFGEHTGQRDYFDGAAQIEPDLLREIGGDLVANLFHLAFLNGLDPRALIEAGVSHFQEELMEAHEEECEEKAVEEFRTETLPALESFLNRGQLEGGK
ncbi:hypothetical protein [Streptomyces hundungensis]|uniref:hypothetical protein n=1 Tax=Streptomyces hundungensis TaxID=1077946 RepID=UPI0031E9F359